jgi:fructose-1,6-bisphosphatase
VGSFNEFGEEQCDVDLVAEEIIFKRLQECDVVKVAMSKEKL